MFTSAKTFGGVSGPHLPFVVGFWAAFLSLFPPNASLALSYQILFPLPTHPFLSPIPLSLNSLRKPNQTKQRSRKRELKKKKKMGAFRRQLKAMLRKNWLLKTRNPYATCAEASLSLSSYPSLQNPGNLNRTLNFSLSILYCFFLFADSSPDHRHAHADSSKDAGRYPNPPLSTVQALRSN